jgi:hypothetical protein
VSSITSRSPSLAVEARAEVLWITPWAHNYRALGFYASRGYKDYGLTYFTFEGESHENRVYAKSLATPPVLPDSSLKPSLGSVRTVPAQLPTSSTEYTAATAKLPSKMKVLMCTPSKPLTPNPVLRPSTNGMPRR